MAAKIKLGMRAPEQQSLTEAAGYSGSAGAKVRQQIALWAQLETYFRKLR